MCVLVLIFVSYAAVINYHKHSGWKQSKFIILQFGSQKSEMGFTELKSVSAGLCSFLD